MYMHRSTYICRETERVRYGRLWLDRLNEIYRHLLSSFANLAGRFHLHVARLLVLLNRDRGDGKV